VPWLDTETAFMQGCLQSVTATHYPNLFGTDSVHTAGVLGFDCCTSTELFAMLPCMYGHVCMRDTAKLLEMVTVCNLKQGGDDGAHTNGMEGTVSGASEGREGHTFWSCDGSCMGSCIVHQTDILERMAATGFVDLFAGCRGKGRGH
jgi:hypothetical protein